MGWDDINILTVLSIVAVMAIMIIAGFAAGKHKGCMENLQPCLDEVARRCDFGEMNLNASNFLTPETMGVIKNAASNSSD